MIRKPFWFILIFTLLWGVMLKTEDAHCSSVGAKTPSPPHPSSVLPVLWLAGTLLTSLWVCFSDSTNCELPLLTPCSKAVMSQALKATFSGFKKEQRRLGIPKSKCCFLEPSSALHCARPGCRVAIAWDGIISSLGCLAKRGRALMKLSQFLFRNPPPWTLLPALLLAPQHLPGCLLTHRFKPWCPLGLCR